MKNVPFALKNTRKGESFDGILCLQSCVDKFTKIIFGIEHSTEIQ